MLALTDRVEVRVIPADVLTPIAAYLALAEPNASCLLESVESGGRLSRYSFLGIDYVAAESFEADGLYDRVRAFVEAHRCEADHAGLGGALLAFSYDAARPEARLVPREPAFPPVPDVYVAIPATWLIFDHFTHTLTIWTRGSDVGALDRRIDGYVEEHINAWDVAAGSLLVLEAGGLIGDLSGNGDYLHGGQVIAANPKVFAQMVRALAPYRSELARKPAPKAVRPAEA